MSKFNLYGYEVEILKDDEDRFKMSMTDSAKTPIDSEIVDSTYSSEEAAKSAAAIDILDREFYDYEFHNGKVICILQNGDEYNYVVLRPEDLSVIETFGFGEVSYPSFEEAMKHAKQIVDGEA